MAERLHNFGVEVFCPLVTLKVRWSDRWKKVKKPLINGYVFARVSEPERREVLRDPGIWRTVFWNGRPALIRDEELEVNYEMFKSEKNSFTTNNPFESSKILAK